MAQAGTGGILGSRTVTLQLADGAAPIFSQPPVQTREEVLSLRLDRRRTKKVSWTAGTVDNEFLNKKSSKKCCMFHKDHGFDSDSSDEDGECEGKRVEKACGGHGHDHDGQRFRYNEFLNGNPGSGGHAGGASTSGSQGQL